MGSPENEDDRDDNEGPQHDVTIAKPFAVGKFEVTVGEYAAFVKATGHDSGNSCWVWNGTKQSEQKGKSWRDPASNKPTTTRLPASPGRMPRPTSPGSPRNRGGTTDCSARPNGSTRRGARPGPASIPASISATIERDLCDYANGADKSSSFDWRNKSCSDGVGEATAAGRAVQAQRIRALRYARQCLGVDGGLLLPRQLRRSPRRMALRGHREIVNTVLFAGVPGRQSDEHPRGEPRRVPAGPPERPLRLPCCQDLMICSNG